MWGLKLWGVVPGEVATLEEADKAVVHSWTGENNLVIELGKFLIRLEREYLEVAL